MAKEGCEVKGDSKQRIDDTAANIVDILDVPIRDDAGRTLHAHVCYWCENSYTSPPRDFSEVVGKDIIVQICHGLSELPCEEETGHYDKEFYEEVRVREHIRVTISHLVCCER